MSFSPGPGEDVVITLTAIDNMTPVFRAAEQTVSAFSGSVTTMFGSLARVGTVAAPILAVGAALGLMAGQASTVQQNVANLNAVLQATQTQLAGLRNQGLQLSQVTQFTDSQILLAQRQLAKGQQNVPQIMAETPGVLNLAGATQSSPQQAASSFIAAQKAFDQQTGDTTATVNALAQATDTSLETLQSFSTGLKNVAPVANATGITLRDTATAIADLSQAGLTGGQGGTAFRTFLQHIERETPQAKKEVDALGLSFYDQAGQLRPLVEIMDQLRQKTAGLTEEQRDASLTTIFGTRGALAAQIYATQGSTGFQQTQRDEEALGTAADINARKLDTLQGSVSKLASSFNVLAVQGGTALLPALRGVADDAEGATNALTSLNQRAAILPQLGVAAAALGGLGLLNRALTRRAGDRASAGSEETAKTAAASAAAQQQYGEAIAQAEFTADAKVASAHQEMVGKIEALDERLYEQFVADQTKMADAAIAADARRVASLEEVQRKTLASIAEIDAAYTASAEEQIDKQGEVFAKQVAYLDIQQETQRKKLAVSQAADTLTPETRLAINQDIDREALLARQAVDDEALARRLDSQRKAADAEQAATRTGAAQSAAAIDEAARVEQESILKASDGFRAAQTEAAARDIQAIKTAAAEKVAAAESSFANVAGGTLPASLGGGIIEGTAAQKLATQTVKQGIAVEAGEVSLASGFIGSAKGFIAPLLASAGSLIGPLTMGILVAATVDDLILKPIDRALVQHAVDSDPTLKTISAQISMTLDPHSEALPDQVKASLQRQRDDAIAEIDKNQKVIDDAAIAAKKAQEPTGQGDRNPLDFVSNKVQDILNGVAGPTNQDNPSVDDAKGKLDAAIALKKQADDALAGFSADTTKQQTSQAKSDIAGFVAGVIDEYDRGSVDITEAQREINRKAIELLPSLDANREAEASQIVSDARKTMQAHKDAADMVARQDAQTYQDNLDAARKARAAGASEEDIAIGVFGTGPTGEDVTAQQVAQAKKHIGDLEQASTAAATHVKDAWTEAASAIGKIDISKGTGSLVAGADELKTATDELARLGLSNASLSFVGDLAQKFKDVSDAEQKATADFDGYMLDINQTDAATKKLTDFQKGYKDAAEAAGKRITLGTANQADIDLYNSLPNVMRNTNTEIGQLQQATSGDWLNAAKSAEDFKKADDNVRSVIQEAGGGAKLLTDVRYATKEAEDTIKWILDPNAHTINETVNVQANIDQGMRSFLGQSGTEPYDEARSTGAPPPPGTPPSGGSGTDYPDFKKFTPISPQEWAAIVNPNSPLAGRETLSELNAASMTGGVDPRYLASYLAQEGGFSTAGGAGAWQVAAHNPGGLKYAGQPGASEGPTSTEGTPYASFNSYKDYFAEMINTMMHQPGWMHNDPAELAGDWTKGPGAFGTDAFNSAADAKLQFYRQYLANEPAFNNLANPDEQRVAGGTASGYLSAAGTGAAVAEGGGGGALSSSLVEQAIFGVAKADIGQQTTVVDGITKAVYGWCEKIVDDLVQQGTGQNIRFPTADAHVRAALAGDPRAGTVVSADMARAGDFVGWTGDTKYAGDASGHIGIYAGGGQYIGTTQQGVQQRAIPEGSGAVYIRPPGDTAVDPNFPDIGPGTQPGFGGNKAYAHNTPTGTSATVPVGQRPLDTAAAAEPSLLLNATKAIDDYTAALSRLSGDNSKQAVAAFDQITAAEKAAAEEKFTPNTPENGPQGKQALENEALQKGIELSTAYAKAQYDIQVGSNDLGGDLQKIRDLDSQFGPLLAQRLTLEARIQAANQQVLADKKAITDEDRKYQGIQDQRKVDDQQHRQQQEDLSYSDAANKRSQDEADTRHSQALQDAREKQTRIYDDMKTREDDRWTTRSRQLEDEGRLLDFNGTEQKRILEDNLKSLDKQDKLLRSQFTAQEQMLSGQVAGAGDRASKDNARELLAITKDYDRQTSETAKKQQDNLKDAIDAETELASKQKYDFETARLAETRQHEDYIKGVDAAMARDDRKAADDDKIAQRKKQNDDWRAADTAAKDQYNEILNQRAIQQTRDTEDAAHQKTINDLNDDITTKQAQVKGWQDEDTALGNILSKWQQLVPLVGQTADKILSFATPGGDIGTGAINLKGSTAAGVPFDQFPAPGSGRGGYASGTGGATAGVHLLAETGPELVFRGGERVLSSTALRTLLGAPAPAIAPQVTNITTTLSFDSGMRTIFDDVARAEIEQVVARHARRTLASQPTAIGTRLATGQRIA